jgi:hypothetical protein
MMTMELSTMDHKRVVGRREEILERRRKACLHASAMIPRAAAVMPVEVIPYEQQYRWRRR